MSSNTISGARAIFRIEGKVVAYASGVDVNEEVLYEPVDVLDSIETSEYVPVGYRVSFNCAIFRTVAGWSAVTGGGPNALGTDSGTLGSIKNPAIGIYPQAGEPGISKILTSGWMTASIQDRLTSKTIYKLEEVKATTYSFSFTARGIVGQQVGFNAIRLKDESSSGIT